MADKIEMSLDDIIKSSRIGKRPAGARGGAGGKPGSLRREAGGGRRNAGGAAQHKSGGGVLKGRNRGGIQKAKFARGDVNSAWKHDLYDGPRRTGGGGIAGGVQRAGGDVGRLHVTNLDFAVSDSDIKELFAEFGPVKKANINYDRSGRSLGTADVVFERRADAMKAINQYNGVPLDGRPMKIQLASDPAALARVSLGDLVSRVGGGGGNPGRRNAANATNSGWRSSRLGAPNAQRRSNNTGRSGGAGAGVRRGGGTSRGRGGRGRSNTTAPTAEELDAELDQYVKDTK